MTKRTTPKKDTVVKEILPTRHRLKCKNVKQKEFSHLISEKEIVIATGPAGVGKAQPLTAKVLTPNGWTTMGELIVGDQVIGDDGKPTTVIQIHPQGKRKIYGVYFSDGSYTECCGEHLWYTETYNDRNHRVKENGKRVSSPIGGSVKSLTEIMDTLYTKRGDKNHMIPMTKPIEFNTIPLIIDPYIMGCLLGDGGLTINKINFTSIDNEVVNEIDSKLPKLLTIDSVPSSKYAYTIKAKNKGLGNNIYLNELNKLSLIGKESHNKFIPDKFLFNNIENRVSILQGLMDTDGYVNKNGTSSFYTSVSFELIKGIRELVQSLGGKCLLNSKIPTYTLHGKKLNGRLAYTLTICMPPNINPFRLSRKVNLVKSKTKYIPKRYITKIELISEQEAKCITIDNNSQLYLTDDYIVTHNSYVAIARAIELIQNVSNQYKKIVLINPAVDADEKLGFIPGSVREKLDPYVGSSIDIVDKIVGSGSRIKMEDEGLLEVGALGFIRGKTIDNTVLVMEEAQNMSPNQMKTLLTRIGANTKFIISGDLDQSDRYSDVRKSGLYDAVARHEDISAFGFIEFIESDIVRNPLISLILDNYKKVGNVKVPEPPRAPKPRLLIEGGTNNKKKSKLLRKLKIWFSNNFKW